MTPQKTYDAINIQYPISQLILAGKKTIETRTYALPKHYVNNELLLIETPGSKGLFQARIVGLIIFSGCFKYQTEEAFYADQNRHFVDKKSPWRWTAAKSKWGWEISKLSIFPEALPAPTKKGIVFTRDISI